MHFRSLGLFLLFFSTFSFANGRAPAVEDFVGMELEQVEKAPGGHEPLFNLEQDVGKIGTIHQQKISEYKPQSDQTISWSPTAWMAIFLILGLPLVSWIMLMNHLRKKASIESASNIEVLEKYRKERELSRKQAEQTRKAS